MQVSRLKANGRAFAHIAEFHPELTLLRRDLHAHPELGFEEFYTARRVKEALVLCGVDEIHEGIGKTGLVAVIRELHRELGCTVLLVEHHIDVVIGLVDRVAVMHYGQLLACDTPDVVMANPTVQQAYLGRAS